MTTFKKIALFVILLIVLASLAWGGSPKTERGAVAEEGGVQVRAEDGFL